MLSSDELSHGTIFILKLWDVGGAPTYWVETLRNDVARRWYDIYRRSDWPALRSEAPDVFVHPASDREVTHVRKTHNRLVFIHTTEVGADEMGASAGDIPKAGTREQPQ